MVQEKERGQGKQVYEIRMHTCTRTEFQTLPCEKRRLNGTNEHHLSFSQLHIRLNVDFHNIKLLKFSEIPLNKILRYLFLFRMYWIAVYHFSTT